MNFASLMEVAIKAAVDSGTVLIEHYGKVKTQKTKESLRDVVTEVDQMSESAVLTVLNEKTPSFGVLTEEKGFLGPESTDYWVVDALDGTINYIHQIPLFCVSIAFVKNGVPVVSAIYNPLAEDLYYGADGVGAFKNQSRLSVSEISISEAVMAGAFSGKARSPMNRPNEFQIFGKINDLSQGCLRTGSAGMNLAYVAEGKFGGCWGTANKVWDVAAGLHLADLAGAQIYQKSMEDGLLKSYVAAAPKCFEVLLDQVKPIIST